jgi:hypothetical protein
MADGDFQFPQAGYSTEPFEPVYAPPRRFQKPVWLHSLLFVATVLTTTAIAVSIIFHSSPTSGRVDPHLDLRAFLTSGLWYSGTIIAILGAHEMGHYLACRIYRVRCVVPYFLPLPFPPTGTLGAVIRIREQFPVARCCSTSAWPDRLRGSWCWCRPCSWASRCQPWFARRRGRTAWLGEPLLFKLGRASDVRDDSRSCKR